MLQGLLTLLLLGCLWVSDQDLVERVHGDADGDGVAVVTDCDDNDAAVLGPTLWYGDGDGDGWGDPTDTELGCVHGEAYVPDGGDCDDTAAAVNPGATELWYDGLDADCDGGDDYDADGDGARPPDHGGDDCDDGEPEVHVGATEICADGLDNDCDGSAGDCGWAGEVDLDPVPVIRGEALGDRLGLTLAALGDVDRDGDDDFAVAAYRAEVADGVDAGLVGLVLDPVSGEELLSSVASARYLGVDADDRTGRGLAAVGEVTGTGRGTLAIGAERYDLGGTRGGGVHLVDAHAAGDLDLAVDGVAVLGEAWFQLGHDVDGPGDLDGDGHDELWIGAPGWGETANTGSAWLVHGPISANTLVSDADSWRLAGVSGDDQLGWQVASGDLTGDGVVDLVATAPGGQGDRGTATVLVGPVTSDRDAADEVQVLGQAGDGLGAAVALVDVDGDGLLDLVLGAPGATEGGVASGVV